MEALRPVRGTVDGQAFRAFFDSGFSETKMFRGTEIKDKRPFLFGSDIPHARKQSRVEFEYRGEQRHYQIAQISESKAGNTYFLEKPYEGTDYLRQRGNSKKTEVHISGY